MASEANVGKPPHNLASFTFRLFLFRVAKLFDLSHHSLRFFLPFQAHVNTAKLVIGLSRLRIGLDHPLELPRRILKAAGPHEQFPQSHVSLLESTVERQRASQVPL